MNRIWAVALFTMREALWRKAWLPFVGLTILAFILVFVQFGASLTFSWQNPYADNIISSFFFFWSWGTLATGLILGCTSLPIERRARMMFTLPMERWQLIAGKLIGAQILLSAQVLVGYGLCIALALRQHLTIMPFSRLGLLTALCSIFVCLCLSIPLGLKLSSPAAGTLSVFLVLLPAFFEALASRGLLQEKWIVTAITYLLPFRVSTHPMNNAFWNSIVEASHYTKLGWSVLFSFLFFLILLTLFRRSELSTKS